MTAALYARLRGRAGVHAERASAALIGQATCSYACFSQPLANCLCMPACKGLQELEVLDVYRTALACCVPGQINIIATGEFAALVCRPQTIWWR